MKVLGMGLLALLFAWVRAEEPERPEVPSGLLTLAEIRALPPNTTIKDIESRVGYVARSAIALPMIAFDVEVETAEQCVMLFDPRSGRLLYAWLVRDGNQNPSDVVVLWPKEMAGKTQAEMEIELEAKRGAR